MQTQEEILLSTLDQLDNLQVPYYVTGSVAVSLYGKPRFTHDIDLVISLFPAHVSPLVERFKSDFYVSAEGLHDAIQRHTMANLIHHATGLKVDLWILDPENDYARMQFERRQHKAAFGRRIYFISPEDIVLQKLLWFKETGSERDWNDIVGVWEFLNSSLDLSYMQQWAVRLSVTAHLQKILSNS